MKLNRAKVLSDDEMRTIHGASLEVLEEIGLYVYSDRALGILKRAGCHVDQNTSLVRFPREIVEKCLRSVPPKIEIYDRDKNRSVVLGDGKTYVASGHNAVYYQGVGDKERHPVTKQEVANFALISDFLENIHVVGIEAMPQDVNPRSSLVHAFEAVVSNTTKPIFWSPETAIETEAILKIIRAVYGEHDISRCPFTICQVSPTSPLWWSTGAVEALIEVVEAGVPLAILPQPYTGVTSPITLAGLLVVHNAELLSGIVLSQLIRPGAPVIYAGAWTTFNMKTAVVLIATPEAAALRVAGAQMAEFYNMPSHSIGPDTDANGYDEQHGWEKMLTAIAEMTAGVSLIVNCGMFSTGFTVSYEQLLLDHEIVSIVYRYLDGIVVNDDTLALDVIRKIGPKGTFLADEHTRKFLRAREHFEAKLSFQDLYETWVNLGGPNVAERAKQEAELILSKHRPRPLPPDVRSKIDEIIAEFDRAH